MHQRQSMVLLMYHLCQMYPIERCPLDGNSLLAHLADLQPEGWRFLVWRVNGQWLEQAVEPGEVPQVAPHILQGQRGDLYFCVNSFSEPSRNKEYCLPSRVLYQDLDWTEPTQCPVRPTIWWETSPDRYQGLWVMDDVMEPEDFASYNKALNRACEADPGTWNLTRVLRLPGSWNGKRSCRVSRARVRVAVPA